MFTLILLQFLNFTGPLSSSLTSNAKLSLAMGISLVTILLGPLGEIFKRYWIKFQAVHKRTQNQFPYDDF